MWFPEPHTPYHAPEPYHSLFDPADLPEIPSDPSDAAQKGFDYDEALPHIRSIYYGMIRMIDDQVRRFYEYLEAAGSGRTRS